MSGLAAGNQEPITTQQISPPQRGKMRARHVRSEKLCHLVS
jgi:hypothetical protein